MMAGPRSQSLSASSPTEETSSIRKLKRTRVRTGCLNCRRKKRKCDEARPTCVGCSKRRESCQWGVKVTFRAENAHGILEDHPSMKVTRWGESQHGFEIMNVTEEVIRDYQQHAQDQSENESTGEQDAAVLSPFGDASLVTVPTRRKSTADKPNKRKNDARVRLRSASETTSVSSSRVVTDAAIANLLYFSQGGTGPTADVAGPSNMSSSVDTLPIDDPLLDSSPHLESGFEFNDQLFTPEGSNDDGIFFPGSAYHELHSTLRNHLIHEVRSNAPTRQTTPDVSASRSTSTTQQNLSTSSTAEQLLPLPPREQPSSDQAPPQLSAEEECALWKNWIDEISPWLDKFDEERHFQHVLPQMARSHDHLRYSMLALSARQLELKDSKQATDRSLGLYQEAIHLLLPQLSTRSTPVIASCVVLCVLEMCSCSPKAWRRHLDGCASLMEAVGMTGFCGGVEQALFWCFARMDVCGGLISSVKTLIPTTHWASKIDMAADIALFKSTDNFSMWANYSVYLAAQVLDLLAPLASANPGGLFFDGPRNDLQYRAQWTRLWKHVEDWHARRPFAMHPVMVVPSAKNNPFPSILYSNAAAISGNQLHHTASLLMLQNKPPSVRLVPRPRSALWHARQICGISMTNHHHGAWTNSIQPLWIAGRCMSHPEEHEAILQLLGKIEKESGWSTRWRADDLKEFWGDLGE